MNDSGKEMFWWFYMAKKGSNYECKLLVCFSYILLTYNNENPLKFKQFQGISLFFQVSFGDLPGKSCSPFWSS